VGGGVFVLWGGGCGWGWGGCFFGVVGGFGWVCCGWLVGVGGKRRDPGNLLESIKKTSQFLDGALSWMAVKLEEGGKINKTYEKLQGGSSWKGSKERLKKEHGPRTMNTFSAISKQAYRGDVNWGEKKGKTHDNFEQRGGGCGHQIMTREG